MELSDTTIVVFLLALARISAAVMTAPVLGSRTVPIRFRLVLALLLTMASLPLIGAGDLAIDATDAQFDYVAMMLSEVTIGAMLGFGVLIVFSAAQIAGTVIGQMAGIQIAGNFDPQSGESTSSVSQLFGILSLAAFALIGGPELVITATLDTFANVPIGTSLHSTTVFPLLGDLLQQSFILTLRGVAPAVAALMISTLVIGLVSRTYPQMNLLGLGLSSNLLVMFLAICFKLGGCVWLFVDDLQQIMALIQDSISQPQSEFEVVRHE